MPTTKQPHSDETKQIPREQWKSYFDRFTRRHLQGDQPEAATIEVVSASLGDQFEAEGVPLLGVSYDSKSNLLELQLEEMEHLVFEPAEIWVIEGDDGFISTLEVVRADGTKEIVEVRKGGDLSDEYEAPIAPP